LTVLTGHLHVLELIHDTLLQVWRGRGAVAPLIVSDTLIAHEIISLAKRLPQIVCYAIAVVIHIPWFR
jgi:hypothetical protein